MVFINALEAVFLIWVTREEFIMTPKILLALAFLGLAALPLEAQDSGMRTIPATEGFAATLVKLEKAIKSGGMKVFTHIDHAAAAKNLV